MRRGRTEARAVSEPISVISSAIARQRPVEGGVKAVGGGAVVAGAAAVAAADGVAGAMAVWCPMAVAARKRQGWMAKAKRKPARGSPCWVPSEEAIEVYRAGGSASGDAAGEPTAGVAEGDGGGGGTARVHRSPSSA
jgi:hypothetical protein